MATTTFPSATAEQTRRWAEEAQFFDRLAGERSDESLRVDPLAIARYSRRHLRKRFHMEYRFSIPAPLAGKRVLDIGCGDGLNSVILAKLGAHVTGLDISEKAIEVARRRAEINEVAERVSFICSPLEVAGLEADSFDVIWGDAILHHVLADLETVIQHLVRACKPGGRLIFAEPVNLMNPLRRLRQLLPARTDVTPDERPLVRAEIELLERYLRRFSMRHYALFGRLDPALLTNYNYERSSFARRALVNVIDAVDYALLSLPWVKRLGGMAIISGRPAKSRA